MMQAHVSETKKKLVGELAALIDKYSIIAAVDMENLPAKQLQRMRGRLRERVELRMAKRRIITQAFEQANKDVKELTPYLKGMPALLFTEENPFSLFKTLKKNKSNAPIKAGQTAPNDIIVPAGSTGFAPGPVIGELGGFGIQTGIEDGKVIIKEDSVVAKEGEEVSSELAGILTRLGIEPMEVGLDLTAAFEDGEIVTKEVLDIDEDAYKQDLIAAAQRAQTLAIETAYPTKDTITLLLAKAARSGLGLALERGFLTKETANLTLAKAAGHATSIAATLPQEALGDEARAAATAAQATPASKDDDKDEKKPEEQKEEKKEDSGDSAAGLGAMFG